MPDWWAESRRGAEDEEAEKRATRAADAAAIVGVVEGVVGVDDIPTHWDGVEVQDATRPRFLRADIHLTSVQCVSASIHGSTTTQPSMACRRTTLRYLHLSTPTQRTFTTTPPRHRLGAATYAQEWNSGTYHYNKSTSKLVPFAHKQTDKLLQHYITQQKKGAGYVNKAAIASHRRKYEKVYVSGSRVKDFGGRVEVEAYVFDAAQAARREEAARQAKSGGGGAQGKEGKDGKAAPAGQRRQQGGQKKQGAR